MDVAAFKKDLASKFGKEEVDLTAEVGHKLAVRVLDSGAKEAYTAFMVGAGSDPKELVEVPTPKGGSLKVRLKDYRLELVALCTVTPDGGERVFKSSMEAGLLPPAAMEKLYEVASRLNGISTEEAKADLSEAPSGG